MHRVTAAPEHVGPPTFLVASERSGTTLLRLMLDSHPELAFLEEFEFVVEAMPDDEHWPELDDYHAYLRAWRWTDDPPTVDPRLDYPALVRSFLEQRRLRDRKPRVGATVHRHFDRLLRIWPDARFIHLIRDGRDVVRSCVAMGWYGNTWSAAERWLDSEGLWDRLAKGLPPERCLEIHYEQLVTTPVAVLTEICRFIGMEYHPAMLEYPDHSSYEPPLPSLAFQWQRKLKRHQIRLVESRIADMLVARGYRLSGLPPIATHVLDRAALRVDNRAGVMLARVRSLGPRLWIQSVITNRIGPESWRDSTRSRVHALMNARLQ